MVSAVRISPGCVSRSQPKTRRSPGARYPARGSTVKRSAFPAGVPTSQPSAASAPTHPAPVQRTSTGGKGKGNGRAHDVGSRDGPEDDGDKPRWLM